jgi:hypothetical protein
VTDYGMRLQTNEELEGWLEWVQEQAVAAVLRGCPPDSAEAAQVVDRIMELAPDGQDRAGLLAGLEAFTDPRIDRYWELTATINGWPPFSSFRRPHEWLLAALRAHQ